MYQRNSISGDTMIGCVFDQCPKKRFPAKELLFLCPGGINCPGASHTSRYHIKFFDQQDNEYPNQFLFRPKRFKYSVRCPASPHQCCLKVCPYCGTQQPISMGDATTIAVIGSSSSGKTCFITSLIHQIDTLLAKQTMYGMSLEWRDDEGREYFRKRHKEMYKDLTVPGLNLTGTPPKSLDITIRFPVRGVWRRLRSGRQAFIPLVFPDPSGELFRSLKEAFFLSFLAQSPQIMLMLDPISSPRYQEERKRQGVNEFDPDVDDSTAALNACVHAIRNESGNSKDRINKDLAVVLTKCDERGLFDPDDQSWNLAQQGRTYDPGLTHRISTLVQQHLEDELGLSGVVSLALENFAQVRFFAATALGQPVIRSRQPDGKVTAKLQSRPNQRRVEEPFLWFLHRRGLL